MIRLKNNKRQAKHGKNDPAIVADIVARIVRAADPEKIVLFGSAARNTMGPDSDYDLLVIKRGKFDYWRQVEAIRKQLWGAGAAVDIVLATPEDVERYRDSFCLVICPAMKEGKVVYECRQAAAKRSARVVEPRKKQLKARRRHDRWGVV